MDSKKLALKIANQAFAKKGYDVSIIDLTNIASFADYFVICSADSDTQVKAISDDIEKNLRDEGIKSWHREGYSSLSWVLLDYVDVVVHIFKKDSREFYNLEKLWGDAPSIKVEDPALKKKEPAKEKKAVKKATKPAAKTKTAKTTAAAKTKNPKTKTAAAKTGKSTKKGTGTRKK